MNDSAKPDERCVSWKVLLPVGPESRMLALGFGNGGLAGLTRSYGNVDTKPVESLQYDVVIIGDKSDGDSCDLHNSISLVKQEGIVVDASRKCISKQLNDEDFRYMRHYAALPTGRPRLFIPLASKKLRAKGLAFHSPGSFRVQIGLATAKALNSLGMRFHLMKHTISLYARSERTFEDAGLARWLSERLGCQVIDLVIFAGSKSLRRKITALAVTADRNRDVVVKIADTTLGTEAIKQESKALHVLAASSIAGQAPKLIAEGQWCGYYIQLQEKATGSNCKQIARLTKSHLEFLSKLSTIGRKVIPLKETRTWRNVKALAETSSLKVLPLPVRVALEKVLSDEFANAPVVCHRTNGDFAPWNIKVNDRKLFVYDWEDSLSKGLALTDIFHFLYRQASLVGPWPGVGKILQDMDEVAQRLSRKANYDIVNYKVILLSWLLGEYLTNPNDYIVEIICCLGFQHQ